MSFWMNIRLKLRNFFRKYYKIIIIVIIAVCIVFSVNYSMKKINENKEVEEKNTINNKVEISNQVIDTTDAVPESYKETIHTLIDSFVNYCNNKKYDEAYSLLSDDFKNIYFKDISTFKKYVNTNFKTKKIYNVQNYSNSNNTYIYNVSLIDDILANGSTGGYNTIEDKFVIKAENGTLKLSLNGYCGSKDLNIASKDSYMEINIVKKDMLYNSETFTVEFKNKTNNYIVLGDGTEENEIMLKVTNGTKKCDMTASNLVILPNETVSKEITFDKYFDDGKEENSLIFNAIRILPEYSGHAENAKKEKKNAVKLYSLNINLKQ